ncbi:TNF receptor-associated factor 6 isoform X2 [Venturia canescens]|uniref:TNF receptor-associated factor 6 isoform X2 n=1 Tax=Venturia canescens TaxID=32260 RepID=UPI001C9D0EC6|nr:TNF receptor-associated factor 6 isoform X2 [Venturia canescens]
MYARYATMAMNDRNNVVQKLADKNDICDDPQDKHIESRFECPICLTWLKDPMLTSCGHKFCFSCITAWLKRESACCPVDGKPLDPVKDLFEDRYTSREISQQRTHCPYQQLGCEAQMSPVEMEKHLAESHAFMCPFKDFGCSRNFQNNDALQEHINSNVNGHLTIAGKALTKLMIAQSEMNSRVLETKPWDPPPKNSAETTVVNSPSLDWQRLLDKMYERIVVLEQQNRELASTLANQQTKYDALQTTLRFLQEETILRNCNGVYIWRLDCFSQKLEEMTSDPLRMFYSPGFYTSSMGYKICARINISSKDSDFLSLLLHIMKSENDDVLDWPFDGTISFELIHPHCPEKSIREKTSSRPDLEAFKKPVCDLNKRSFGYTEFARIHELKDFLQDNCLLFRIEVKSFERPRDSEV